MVGMFDVAQTLWELYDIVPEIMGERPELPEKKKPDIKDTKETK